MQLPRPLVTPAVAGNVHDDNVDRWLHTMQTSIRSLGSTATSAASQVATDMPPTDSFTVRVMALDLGNTGKGILIGVMSAFGSAAMIAIIFAVIYFFRYTSRGKIFLDRLGRPGEYDDEQAFLREEEEALQEMDDLQRQEYLRAKGKDIQVNPRPVGLTLLQHSYKQTRQSPCRRTSHYHSSSRYKRRACRLGNLSRNSRSPIASLSNGPRSSSLTRNAAYKPICPFPNRTRYTIGKQRSTTNLRAP